MLAKVAAAAVLIAVACSDNNGLTAADAEGSSLTDPKTCALLPNDDSACAHACDEDALRAFILHGTCATFSCPLRDGTTLVVGGCN